MTQDVIKRIAIGAVRVESNRHAPVLTLDKCRRYLKGEQLKFGFEQNVMPTECKGFKARLDQIINWKFVPMPLLSGGAAGELEQACFDMYLNDFAQELKQALPVDAVYLPLHGGAAATEDPDPEGSLLTLVRAIVGPDVPIVISLDLHAHVTQKMLENCDFMCSYLTNPHVDMYERGEEVANVLMRIFDGLHVTSSLVKVPMMGPSTTLGTDAGPYADILAIGQEKHKLEKVVNLSICSGFSVGDNVYGGMSVVVATDDEQALADRLALEIANLAWQKRHQFNTHLMSIDEAVKQAYLACEGERRPVILADVADNPGGGGTGNTLYILEALIQAKCHSGFVGCISDPELVQQAFRLGEGDFIAHFNRSPILPFAQPFMIKAKIRGLYEGQTACRRGLWAGSNIDLGKRVLLDIAGIQVLITSNRMQMAEPMIIEELDINISDLRFLMVKSRGHFRAGFDEFFSPEQVIEVDAPGLTTPVLSNIPYEKVRRPIYPLDKGMSWLPYLGDYQP